MRRVRWAVRDAEGGVRWGGGCEDVKAKKKKGKINLKEPPP